MKTTHKDFELFKKWFTHYQTIFELNCYQVFFEHKKVPGVFADMTTDQMGKVATVRFSKVWENRAVTEDEIRKNALHECCHLLINRLAWLAECRYVTDSEIKEEDESLTKKLVHAILTNTAKK